MDLKNEITLKKIYNYPCRIMFDSKIKTLLLDELLNIYYTESDLIKSFNQRNHYIILQRINNIKSFKIKCCLCNSFKSIQIHHINHDKNINSLDNLIFLCSNCHHKQHQKINFKVNQILNSNNLSRLNNMQKDYNLKTSKRFSKLFLKNRS